MAATSEIRVYEYINRALRDAGFDSTPPPPPRGSVYVQGEFRRRDPLLTNALGQKTPDFIVTIAPQDRYWVIEAKPPEQKISKATAAIRAAVKQAKSYANKINANTPGTARFATGVVGSENDRPLSLFYVETHYWDGRKWLPVEINKRAITGFLTKEQCQDILERNDASILDYEVDPEKFLARADAINQVFHENEIMASGRAKVMAALLLALAKDRHLRIHDEPQRLVDEINGNVKELLRECGKEEFAGEVTLRPPASPKNHNKYRTGIVRALQHLRDMNIRSAINSGDDALGKFYETFLSYANDAKKMGIVLTPRHITQFAVEVTCVSHKDMVLDPACGTGGFLIAALDHIRRQNPRTYKNFGLNNLYGVENTDAVYGLAIVNMIFRGDGKSHIYDGDCFDHSFWRKDGQIFYTTPKDKPPSADAKKPFSRVLMNPPFSLKNTPAVLFVNHALEQMKKGGLCFAILPTTCFSGRQHQDWRERLMASHTIKAVVTLDKSLFSPVTASTCGIIIEAHKPHIAKAGVFFGVLHDDNHRLKISKVASQHDKQDNLEQITERVRKFVGGSLTKINIPREALIASINPDMGCDFAPEAYLNNYPKIKPDRVKILTRSASLSKARSMAAIRQAKPLIQAVPMARWFPLADFIASEEDPTVANLKDLLPGNTPVVSATAEGNGISDWKEIADSDLLRECITISRVHNTKPCQAFWHPYNFAAINTVHIIKPIAKFVRSDEAAIYLCQAITESNAWKYRYERPVRMHELEVYLPATKQHTVDISRMIKIASHK